MTVPSAHLLLLLLRAPDELLTITKELTGAPVGDRIMAATETNEAIILAVAATRQLAVAATRQGATTQLLDTYQPLNSLFPKPATSLTTLLLPRKTTKAGSHYKRLPACFFFVSPFTHFCISTVLHCSSCFPSSSSIFGIDSFLHLL